jgi:uncharacterized membrane protein
MPFNASQLYTNPAAQSVAVYTDVLGGFFFAILMFLFMGYTLIKTESWGATSIVGLLISILFYSLLPSIVILIICIFVLFTFAAILVDVLIL